MLRRFYRCFQIPVSLWLGDEERLISIVEGFMPDPALHYMKMALERDTEETYLLHRHETLYGLVRAAGSNTAILLGPVNTGACSDEYIAKILRDLGQ